MFYFIKLINLLFFKILVTSCILLNFNFKTQFIIPSVFIGQQINFVAQKFSVFSPLTPQLPWEWLPPQPLSSPRDTVEECEGPTAQPAESLLLSAWSVVHGGLVALLGPRLLFPSQSSSINCCLQTTGVIYPETWHSLCLLSRFI